MEAITGSDTGSTMAMVRGSNLADRTDGQRGGEISQS